MIFWLDAHLAPRLAPWIEKEFGTKGVAARDLKLQFAKDEEIFQQAKTANAVLISKDRDFQEMVLRLGSPHKSSL
jgi:predicted nuclease of predicted toxin-antitoxin system